MCCFSLAQSKFSCLIDNKSVNRLLMLDYHVVPLLSLDHCQLTSATEALGERRRHGNCNKTDGGNDWSWGYTGETMEYDMIWYIYMIYDMYLDNIYIYTVYCVYIYMYIIQYMISCVNKRNQRTRMQSRKTLLWNKFLNSPVHVTNFHLLPYQCAVDSGMWKGLECQVRSVKKVECWVGIVVCRVWSLKWGLWSVKCKVWGGKCKV